MKAIILAGGAPSTVTYEDERIPKPMAEIGEHPILWHIMKYMSSFGINEFIICAGYKSELIKDYFSKFYIYNSDIMVDLGKERVEIINKKVENWRVTVIDTGITTSVISRIKKAMPYIGNEAFLVTYGDCLYDIDLSELIKFHKKSDKIATISVAHPTGRSVNLPIDSSGNYSLDMDMYHGSNAWIDACVFAFNPEINEYLDIKSDFIHETIIPKLAELNQVATYRHNGFWSSMETMRDQSRLEGMWKKDKAPWKVWED